jgi:Holliday junction DNA helicase RuvA
MIGFLKGTLLKKEEDRVLLLAGHVGYEVYLPAVVMETLAEKGGDEEISFHIYYHQTDRQPKPVLIGFNLELEKEFFQYIISVEDIGPLKALKAFNLPLSEIAAAIENRDVSKLKKLKGIGQRTAQKMIATLEGKMDRFVLAGAVTDKAAGPAAPPAAVAEPVLVVLVEQLGHRRSVAKKMIEDALGRNPEISTPEQLFDEVYKGEESA